MGGRGNRQFRTPDVRTGKAVASLDTKPIGPLLLTTPLRPAGVDSKTKTDKDDGSHTKDLQKVRNFVAKAKVLR